VTFVLCVALVASQSPEEIVKKIQEAQATRSETESLIKQIGFQTLKRCCKSPLFENFQTVASLPNVDYFQQNVAPFPGFYALLASGSAGLSPWTYHQCPEGGKHLYVNGMNTNWSPSYRRIYTYTGTLEKGQTYRFCFFGRNLPTCMWDAKPFGYISYSTSNIGFWNLNVLTLVGCTWKEVVSSKFVGTGLSTTISIMLYNGWYNDGNDLVIDNVRIVKLMPQPLLSIYPSLGSYNGVTYTFLASSASLPSDNCLDYWYLYQGLALISQGVATPSTSIEFTIPGLQVGIKYTVKVKRVCDCSTDAFWSSSFSVTPLTADKSSAERLALSETSNETFDVPQSAN